MPIYAGVFVYIYVYVYIYLLLIYIQVKHMYVYAFSTRQFADLLVTFLHMYIMGM